MNKETTETVDLNLRWRQKFSRQIGGFEFDAPGGGYSFSAVLAEERELEKANALGNPGSALLKLSVADPTWKMLAEAMDAAREYFDAARDASRYKDITGVRGTPETIMKADTHELLAACLQLQYRVVTESGKGLTADWVQHSSGSIKRALAEYIPTLFGDESMLLFPSPGYQVIASPMNRRGALLADVPMIHTGGRWAFDMDALTMMVVTQGRPQIHWMYVNLPHNPTGMGYTRSDWEGLIAWACQYSVTLVVDEAYIDLRYRDDIVSALQVPGWERCCIVLQSVSKGWNATGLRFGWIVAYPTVIKALRKLMDVKDSGMFGPSIAAGIWCLLHPGFALETRAKYRDLHQALAIGLQKAGFAGGMPDAGLCQFTPAPKSADGIAFANAAECARWFRSELRISVMHAEAAGGQWLRWAVTLQPVPECGLPTEGDIIAETVRRLQSVKFVF